MNTECYADDGISGRIFFMSAEKVIKIGALKTALFDDICRGETMALHYFIQVVVEDRKIIYFVHELSHF